MNETPPDRSDDELSTEEAARRQDEGINPADGPGPYGNPEIDRDKLEKTEDEIGRTGH
ncbi:MAG: hypothetical protein H0W09_03015 [Solirubrobacterales bacterium]|nr:hypothetical protein [Solirubrobacterales bacterium]